ncbi:hypothetical protein VTN49DRAFT_7135 [Thermomyces lanuginosus]|uniref:uncharacterized protein n=1 Tax=Thermomyces lanuginosus TaxID=5541 RepID=UPI0037440DEC
MSSTHLKPPPHRHASGTSSGTASPTPPPPRPPISAHPTTTIADSAVLHGTHPVTIGAGTVIHPRARIYSYTGPVQIGDGCIISEKSVIGDEPPNPQQPTSLLSRSSSPSRQGQDEKDVILTRISSSVSIAPQCTIRSGATVRSAAVLEPLVTVNRYAVVGTHAKLCAACVVPERAVVEDWSVIWSMGGNMGCGKRMRNRKRIGVGATTPGGTGTGTEGEADLRRVEDARLLSLHKEREGLARLIGLTTASSARRR